MFDVKSTVGQLPSAVESQTATDTSSSVVHQTVDDVTINVAVGEFVVVQYEDCYYPGNVEDSNQDGEVWFRP